MTMQMIYETILKSNIINFTIMVSTLVWIFKKYHLGKIFDDIADDIKNNVNSSALAVKNALDNYKQIKKEQKTLDSKKQVIIDNANGVIKKLNEKNATEIKTKQDELENIKNKTKEILVDKIKEKTADDIKNIVYELSYDIVKDNITDEIRFSLIKNALDELDEIKEVKF